MVGQYRHIFEPLAQWRHFKRNHVQAKEQIGAESSLFDLIFESLVRRGDHSHVYTDRRVAADRFEPLLFQNAQHFRLRVRTHVRDFIEKERRAIRQFELAFLRRGRTGEGTLHVTEQFRFD